MTTEKYEFIREWQPILSKFVAPLFILSIIFLIVALLLLIVKKHKKSYCFCIVMFPICFVAFYGALSVSSDWHRNIMIHDTFFDGEGTPISEIADQYKDAVESYADKIVQPEQESSIKVAEKEPVTYANFDDYAMEAFNMESFCDIASHDIQKSEDGSYQWVISIENVTDFDKLMVSAFIIGVGINPSMQETMIAQSDIVVTQAIISIDGDDGAVMILMPPIALETFFMSSLAARESYPKKEEIETAYINSELSTYDMI